MALFDDDFGNRMKFYESFETDRRFLPMLPLYARIDGRGFSKFTKGMNRPYDIRMMAAMQETVKYLVEHTNACLGYTQSDEISLVWKPMHAEGAFFAGKIQKMTSVLASMATAAFTKQVNEHLPEYADRMPHFDCRLISFPNEAEATNMILWRTVDAAKNAVSMAAREYYSHAELQNKSSAEMQEMLFAKGINFNDYPTSFKQGIFVRRQLIQKSLADDVVQKLQSIGKPVEESYTRSVVSTVEVPIFSKVINRVEFVFHGADPINITYERDEATE